MRPDVLHFSWYLLCRRLVRCMTQFQPASAASLICWIRPWSGSHMMIRYIKPWCNQSWTLCFNCLNGFNRKAQFVSVKFPVKFLSAKTRKNIQFLFFWRKHFSLFISFEVWGVCEKMPGSICTDITRGPEPGFEHSKQKGTVETAYLNPQSEICLN